MPEVPYTMVCSLTYNIIVPSNKYFDITILHKTSEENLLSIYQTQSKSLTLVYMHFKNPSHFSPFLTMYHTLCHTEVPTFSKIISALFDTMALLMESVWLKYPFFFSWSWKHFLSPGHCGSVRWAPSHIQGGCWFDSLGQDTSVAAG